MGSTRIRSPRSLASILSEESNVFQRPDLETSTSTTDLLESVDTTSSGFYSADAFGVLLTTLQKERENVVQQSTFTEKHPTLADTLPQSILSSSPNLMETIDTSLDDTTVPEPPTCQLSKVGSFGDLAEAQIQGGKTYVVSFSYQAAVVSDANPVVLSQTVFPQLDRAVGASILSKFFLSCASSHGSTFQRRDLQSSKGSAIEALSSLPMDQFVASQSK